MAARRRRYAYRIAMIAAVLVLGIVIAANTRPGLDRYATTALPAAKPEPGKLRVTFLGVSTLLFDDGETAILTDGFFSRPGKVAALVGRVEPDFARVTSALNRARVSQLAAVVPLHTHYDHAMDSAAVAQATGALLIGSESAAWIGRGAGLAEDRIAVIQDGSVLRFGRYTLTWIASAHVPSPKPMPGRLRAPLVPPARVGEYLEGGCWSLIVEHEGRRLLVQASAGFVEGALRDQRVDVAYLGIGLLGRTDETYRNRYWDEVVRATGARRIIPIHWDDFWRSLDEPLVAMPWLADGVSGSLDFVGERSKKEGRELRMPEGFVAVDPFAGM